MAEVCWRHDTRVGGASGERLEIAVGLRGQGQIAKLLNRGDRLAG